eukprot:scaffold4600_cov169-Amphora_coffeaeformis.AAC.10
MLGHAAGTATVEVAYNDSSSDRIVARYERLLYTTHCERHSDNDILWEFGGWDMTRSVAKFDVAAVVRRPSRVGERATMTTANTRPL